MRPNNYDGEIVMDAVIAWFFEYTSIIAFGVALLLGIIGFVRRANQKKGHIWEP